MPGKFNYEIRSKYPHLIGEDSLIWTKFITLYPERFDTVDYDVKVGQGVDTTPIPEGKYQQYWAELTKKRIDVIGYKDNLVTIVEVKKRVGLPTLGQILGYKFLYLREYPEITSLGTLIVCSSIDQDDIDVLEYYGMHFIKV